MKMRIFCFQMSGRVQERQHFDNCNFERFHHEGSDDEAHKIGNIDEWVQEHEIIFTDEIVISHFSFPSIFPLDINDATFEHFYKLLEPKFIEFNSTIKNHRMLEALLELNVQDDDEFELLSEQYKNLLLNKQDIEKRFKYDLYHLDQMFDILKDFLADKNKFKGASVKDNLDKVSEALSTCDDRESLLEAICSLTSENWAEK